MSNNVVVSSTWGTTTNVKKLNDGSTDSILAVGQDRVGIGTTSPHNLSHLYNTGTPQLVLTDSGAASGSQHKYICSGSGYIFIGKADNSWNYTDQLIIDNNGYVGIGTAYPSWDLTIEKSWAVSTGRGILIKNTNNTDANYPAEIAFDKSAVNANQTASVGISGTSRNFYIHVHSGDAVNITPSGYVGIGTVSPGSPLCVAGSHNGGSTGNATFGDTRMQLKIGAGDDANAGTIDYGGFDANSLGIVGKGTTNSNRNVRIFDTLSVGYSNPSSGIAVFKGFMGIRTTSPASGLHITSDAGSASDMGYITLEQLGTTPSAPGTGKSIIYMRNGHLCTRVGTGNEVTLA